jgi:hypothetical protein
LNWLFLGFLLQGLKNWRILVPPDQNSPLSTADKHKSMAVPYFLKCLQPRLVQQKCGYVKPCILLWSCQGPTRTKLYKGKVFETPGMIRAC